MTRKEAINIISQMIKDEEGFLSDNTVEAHKMAIKALEQEPCEDAISRQAVEKITWEEPSYTDALNVLTEVRDKVRTLPSVIPQPKTGHWILADEQNKEDVENGNYRFICSECQYSDIHAKGVKVPYCWKCGARMESEGK